MEKGSFHRENDERVKTIPLPHELPKEIDLRSLPASALKSSTLECLISQNEDLMARLSVSLRKINELEETTAVLEQEKRALRTRFEAVKEQADMLQEKDRMSSARTIQLQDENFRFRTQIERLERLYAELFVQSQSAQRKAAVLERYRGRVRQAATSVQRRARSVPALERELAALKQALSQSTDQLKAQAERVQDRDQLYEEKVRIENQLVFEQRQHAQSRTEAQEELDRLRNTNADLRLQLKESLVAQEAHKHELENLTLVVPSLRAREEALTEQVESLQALWGHKQKELELLMEKNSSLQRLNQSISVTLNQQRKEIHLLKADLEQERFHAQEKTKTLLAEIQMLRAQLLKDEETSKL
ncbi:MAG: hypothetical protein AB7G93_18960 [Bdellovibrionales bacterium]